MAQNKTIITPENLNEWLASTGFLFPRNEVELKRFETLYKNDAEDISDMNVDVERILNGVSRPLPSTRGLYPTNLEQSEQYRMVARKGGEISPHILDRIKKNQEKGKKDDNESSENSAK